MLGNFSNDVGNGSENVTIKMNLCFVKSRRDYSNSLYVQFPGVEFLETALKFRKRMKSSLSCIYVLHKTSH